MPIFEFPYRRGSVPAPPSSTTTVTPPLWGRVANISQPWNMTTAVGVLTPFEPLKVPRLEPIRPQIPIVIDNQVNFAHRMTSQFPWICATGNQVYLYSIITGR